MESRRLPGIPVADPRLGPWRGARYPGVFRVVRASRRTSAVVSGRAAVGSVIKKRRKRMAKKKHRKLLKKTRIQRRRQGK